MSEPLGWQPIAHRGAGLRLASRLAGSSWLLSRHRLPGADLVGNGADRGGLLVAEQRTLRRKSTCQRGLTDRRWWRYCIQRRVGKCTLTALGARLVFEREAALQVGHGALRVLHGQHAAAGDYVARRAELGTLAVARHLRSAFECRVECAAG